MKQPFSILKEDYEKSSKRYLDIYNCPAGTAFKRQFPQLNLLSINPYFASINTEDGGISRAHFTDKFTQDEFEVLEKEGREFHTEIQFD